MKRLQCPKCRAYDTPSNTRKRTIRITKTTVMSTGETKRKWQCGKCNATWETSE